MPTVKTVVSKVFFFSIWLAIVLYIAYLSLSHFMLRGIDHEVATTYNDSEGFVSGNPISVKKVDPSDVKKTTTQERVTGVKWNYYRIGQNDTIGVFSYHQIKEGDILTITSPTEKVQEELRNGRLKKFEEFSFIESVVKNSKNVPFVKVCITNGSCFSAIRL
ncbi:hypothetical protein KC225_25605 [Klebsiella pneumoniae]|uniref:hypothetical protein n=1 Tax=Klebsiella pneumoniae TaxID=573 RepID=UPI001B827C9C|nr:hypothetical protein [Klebsiella pneumoniae]MBR7607068.1 hypothetical protein [Klebsiella pneumoniae]